MGTWETIDWPGYMGKSYADCFAKWTSQTAEKPEERMPQLWRFAWQYGEQTIDFTDVRQLLCLSYKAFMQSQPRFLEDVINHKPPMQAYKNMPGQDWPEQYMDEIFTQELADAVALCGVAFKPAAAAVFNFMKDGKMIGEDVLYHPVNLPFIMPKLIREKQPKHYGGAPNQQAGLPSMMPGSFMHFFYHNRMVQVYKGETKAETKM
jgi:hypothetical protein